MSLSTHLQLLLFILFRSRIFVNSFFPNHHLAQFYLRRTAERLIIKSKQDGVNGLVQREIAVVIDGQGGGIGKAVIEKLKKELPGLYVRALGTNGMATAAMLKAGADDGATGENAVIVNAKKAAVILGVVPVLMPNGILGELTPKMAEAIGESSALKILIPVNRCNVQIAMLQEGSLQQYIDKAVELVKDHMQS